MWRHRPSRLHGFDYTAFQRYHLRFGTADRRRIFTSPVVVSTAHAQILRACQAHGFALLAYCFMPDHVHLVPQGLSPDADLRRLARVAKQQSGYALRRECALTAVWQVGYFERVLRDTEPTERVVRYVLNNPVRGGLVARTEDYPFSGAMYWPE